MRKCLQLLTITCLVAATALPAAGQIDQDTKELYESYIEQQVKKQTPHTTTYRSPEVFEDTVMAEPVIQPSSKGTETPATDQPRESRETDSLRLFGYDMFSQSASDFAPPLIATVPPDYRLGPGDNILVNLWGRVDMEMDLTVNREGTVFIPKVGEIVCNSLTLDEVKARLKQRLSAVYSDFRLGVSLGKIRTIQVYVYGEVKQPGGYALSSLSTLFNALYAARGPNERGSMRRIRLLRGGRLLAEVDLYKFLLSGDLSGNLALESEDVVFVSLANGLVSVTGEVRRPAIYELRDGEQIGDVLDMAGGTASAAYIKRVMVERVGNDHRNIIDVNLAELDDDAALLMQDGDVVTVFATDQTREDIVWIDGHVKHPGVFQLADHPRVSNLILEGDQLYNDSYRLRADLIRTLPESRQELIPVDLEAILSGADTANIALQDQDSLVVYSIADVTREKHVTITGEVERPGTYELYENMKLSDLIFRAGTLKRNAFLLSAEVARLMPDGDRQLYSVDLRRLINGQDPASDLVLVEDDQVFIRRIPGWEEDRTVTVAGEVRFPGKYSLSYREETLGDLIERAGGLTEYAFPQGAIFLRPTITEELKHKNVEGIIRRSAEFEQDSTGRITSNLLFDLDSERMSRIVMDLETILNSTGNENDIVLRPGDRIYIPMTPYGVQVMGAVASAGTIGYVPDEKPSFYLEKAGGFIRSSDKEETRVIKADGRVMSWDEAKGKRIDLGDAIAVPTRVTEDRDWLKILSNTATVIGGLATTVFVIDKL